MSWIDDTKELPEGVFHMNLKIVNRYQYKDPWLKAKYDMGMYHKGYFCGGSNINIKLIMCEDNIVITSIL